MESNPRISSEATFALKEGPISDTVLRALTELHDGDPTEMQPLYEVIDLDALDGLFRGPNPGTVTFEYGQYTVTVREDAEVILRW